MVRVAVKDAVERVAIQRLFKSAAAEKRVNLKWLCFDGSFDRGVVEQCVAAFRPQAREGGFELQRFFNRFVNELLDDFFSPGREHSLSEATAKTFYACEADSQNLARFAVKHFDSHLFENLPDIGFASRFVIVIAQYGNDGNSLRRTELLGKQRRLVGKAVVGQITASSRMSAD